MGAAFAVHNELRSGFVEKVHENALAVELRRRDVGCETQRPVGVRYRGEPVGDFVADLVVENSVLVEIKAVKTILAEHESKLIHYLKATGIEVGLLINFGEGVEVKRKIHTQNTSVENL